MIIYLPHLNWCQIKILYFIDKVVFRIFKLSKLDLHGLIISIWFLLFSLFLYRVFSLTWPASMQIYWNKRKRLHKKRVQLPQGWFGTPTWSPFHCFGTPISLYNKAVYLIIASFWIMALVSLLFNKFLSLWNFHFLDRNFTKSSEE